MDYQSVLGDCQEKYSSAALRAIVDRLFDPAF
jgi:hypothetical protein